MRYSDIQIFHISEWRRTQDGVIIHVTLLPMNLGGLVKVDRARLPDTVAYLLPAGDELSTIILYLMQHQLRLSASYPLRLWLYSRENIQHQPKARVLLLQNDCLPEGIGSLVPHPPILFIMYPFCISVCLKALINTKCICNSGLCIHKHTPLTLTMSGATSGEI